MNYNLVLIILVSLQLWNVFKTGNKDLEERAQVIIPEIMENTKNEDDELPKTLTKQWIILKKIWYYRKQV